MMTPIKPTALLLSALLLPFSTISATEGDPVVIINDNKFDAATFNGYIAMRVQQAQHRGPVDGELRKLLLQEFINSELLYQAALKEGIDQNPAVKLEIEMQRRNVIITAGLNAHLEKTLTEEALTKAYEEKYGQSSTEYRTRHILVENESDANNIIGALQRGEDFEKLAATASIDPSSSEGGDLGWLSTAEMPPTFAAAVETLKPGEYSTSPVQSGFGWHIILLDELRTIAPPPLDSVAGELATELQSKVVAYHIETLRGNAAIEIK